MTTNVPIWGPQPGPQSALLQCPFPDVFYGGARGGGKTDGLLGDFLSHAGRYGRRARGIIFRRSLPELDEVIERSQAIYGPLGWTYKVQKHIWDAPDGAFLRMRYLDNDADASLYQGHSYTWEGFDELTHWPSPKPIDKLWACLRSPYGIPCVRRSTGNPGGAGHVWVKKRYRVDTPLVPFEYEPLPGARGIDGKPLLIKAVFIPSKLEDNLMLMRNDPTYETRIAAGANNELWKGWRYGDWNILAGQYFDLFDEEIHTVEPELAMPPGWAHCWISMDWGFNDQTVILWHRTDENGNVFTYREAAFSGKVPVEIGRYIAEVTPATEKISLFYLSPDAFHRRESPRTICDGIASGLPEKFVRPIRADDDRIGGWQLMYQMLKSGTWVISRACPVLIESIPALVRKEDHPEDIEDSPLDHAPDAARYGLKSYVRESRQATSELVKKRILEIPDETSRSLAWMMEKEKSKYKHMSWQKPKRWVGR